MLYIWDNMDYAGPCCWEHCDGGWRYGLKDGNTRKMTRRPKERGDPIIQSLLRQVNQ